MFGGVTLITLKQFIALHDGKYLDFDHVYGAQCVDLVQFYLRDVLGLPPLPGNAINEFGEDAKQLHWTHNNLLEFMAIGTAVKRRAGATPITASLPVQAIIRDRDTWISGDDMFASAVKSGGGGGGD